MWFDLYITQIYFTRFISDRRDWITNTMNSSLLNKLEEQSSKILRYEKRLNGKYIFFR